MKIRAIIYTAIFLFSFLGLVLIQGMDEGYWRNILAWTTCFVFVYSGLQVLDFVIDKENG